MPEDFEAETPDLQEELNQETPEGESEAPPETQPQGREISASEKRIREIYSGWQTDRQLVQQLQQNVMNLQQQLMNASRPAPQAAPKIDSEIDELVTPSINSRLSPLEQRLARQEQINATLYADREAQAAWDYVQTSVPDINDLAPDIKAYLANLPASRVQKITSDPDLVIQTAELVRAMKAAGHTTDLNAAKQDLKQRGKSNAGTASPATFSGKIDWNDPNLDWEKAEMMLEKQRRQGR